MREIQVNLGVGKAIGGLSMASIEYMWWFIVH
jgi:hypothetical protein